MKMTLEVNSLANQAYEIIKSKILNGEIPQGSRLVDSQLAERFGISRTPMRDAIRKLHEEGLVVNSGARGYFVFKPTVKDITEIFEIRLLIDIAAATKLIENVLPNDPEARKVFEEYYVFFEDENNSEHYKDNFVKSDEDFHGNMIRMMNNDRLYSMYCEIRNQTRVFRQITSGDDDRRSTAFRTHGKICKALLDLDLRSAVDLITKHIEYSKNSALCDFEDSKHIDEDEG